jgi:lysophospholipase L1-like esterase
LRARFSNAYGTNSVTINSAHVALSSGAGSAGNGDINTATDKALTFRAAPAIVIPPGEVMLSDPFEYALPALTNVAVSIYFGNISATTINGHPGSRTTSFIKSGKVASAANMTGASTTAHWYVITGIDVLADAASKAVVTLGDSITDGRGSTTDGNDRWPDNLAQRLITNAPTAGGSVVNMGIGGNAISRLRQTSARRVGGVFQTLSPPMSPPRPLRQKGRGGVWGGEGVFFAPAAVNRFDRDVPNQSGVRWLMVFEGVNDIGGNASAALLISAYQQFAAKAHANNLRAYGATISPFGGNGYYTTAHETVRQTVNAWFRTNTVYAGVIDFDAVVRDPVTLTNIQAAYYSGVNASDGLHLNVAGYQAMADAIDLNLFAQ